MKFCWCTINVKDMDESLKFYQEIVGLKLNRRYNAVPGTEISFLGEGETQVELIARGAQHIQIGDDISIGFTVNSVDEMMETVKAKGFEVIGPMQPNPHIKFFYIKDPDGLRVQFVENIK